MCGICGFVEPDLEASAALELIRGMCASMVHRGPDSDGYRVEGDVALGIRRLRVIDLETGDQPISNEDGTVHVVCNGEIYNFLELRRELEGRGHVFGTKSDVEVLAHLYEDYGELFVQHLHGMFAFCLYDSTRQRLILGRDRLGIKPLHYYWDGQRLVFGSTLDAVLMDPRVSRRVDPAALSMYCTYLYIPAPLTILKDICKLPPGHLLVHSQGSVRIEKYWDIENVTKRAPADSDADELLDLLRGVVKDHLVSDVPLGVLLSGGVDSSAIVAMVASLQEAPVKTFSVGFEEEGFDELVYARLVSKAFRTEHVEVKVRPEAMAVVQQVVDHLDEPMGDFSCIPMYLISQVAREQVTVVLSGDGGDELFGGYDRYFRHRVRERYQRLPEPIRLAARRLVSLGKGSVASRLVASFDRAALPFPESFYQDSVQVLDAQKAEVLHADVMHAADAIEPFERLLRPTDSLDNMLLIDLKLYLPDDILFKVDRMSMAHSLEARVPLLDHRFVEFCYSLPSSVKMRGLHRKHIFKKALKGSIPGRILRRRKQGFGPPLSRWFRNELQDLLRDVLFDRRTRARGWFNAAAVSACVDDHIRGERDSTNLLWGMFVLELWCRKTLDTVPAVGAAQ